MTYHPARRFFFILLLLGFHPALPWGLEAGDADHHPLAPPDRTNPLATLESFRSEMNTLHAIVLEGKDRQLAGVSFRRAIGCLDLSEIAPTLHGDVGGYASLLLKEVFDRLELPEFAEDDGDLENVAQWTVPGTEIVIVRMEEGEFAGQYLFSGRTVERAAEFYERVRDLPVRTGESRGLLDFYIENPGGLVPVDWASRLPSWSLRRFFDRPVWKWLALLLFVVFAVVALRLVRRLGRWWDARFSERHSYLRFGALSLGFTLVLLSWGLEYYVDDVIGLRGDIEAVIKRGSLVLAFAFSTFCIFAVFELIASIVVASTGKSAASANAHLSKLIVRLAGISVVVFMVVEASAYLGWAVAPVVAGLGVGGLALALAARPSIENVIGGLTLFADKPFRVGDLCRLGEDIGHIQEIGLRSTRVRTLDRSLVSIPNADLAVMKIENLGRRDKRLLNRTLGLRYETTGDQLRWALAKIREMLISHPATSREKMRARFVGYGAYSLDVEVNVYLNCRTQDDFRAIGEDLMLRIMDIVRESGTSFAFPSQVNYFRRDTGGDAERQQTSEKEVEEWRQRGEFPFPEFGATHAEKIRDTLDYPPKESPEDGNPAKT